MTNLSTGFIIAMIVVAVLLGLLFWLLVIFYERKRKFREWENHYEQKRQRYKRKKHRKKRAKKFKKKVDIAKMLKNYLGSTYEDVFKGGKFNVWTESQDEREAKTQSSLEDQLEKPPEQKDTREKSAESADINEVVRASKGRNEEKSARKMQGGLVLTVIEKDEA